MRTPPEQQDFAIYSRKSKFTGKGESIDRAQSAAGGAHHQQRVKQKETVCDVPQE